MFAPGPSTTWMPYLCASLPIAAPIFLAFSGSQLEATVAAVGKDVAGRLFVTPLSPPSVCTLSPCGPSDIRRDGIRSLGTGLVNIKAVPATRAAFSSVVSSLMILSMFIDPLDFLFVTILYQG